MIHSDPAPEPPTFDAECRQPGNAWWKAHPQAERPRDYWSAFKPALASAFRQLCAYTAVYEPVGTVDHFLSWEQGGPAYDWSNFRFAAQWINSSKKTIDRQVLDPFQVQDDWFEILLPSLQLRLTDAVPKALRKKAEFTLERLHLRDDERVLRTRQSWLEQFCLCEITLAGLARRAPLLARAVEAALWQHVRKHRRITWQEAATVCFVPEKCARRLLQELVEQGKLIGAGRRRGTHYRKP
ncbi:MAG: hypothetical protein L0Z62_44855 [Gemmataceae bacterium]|nr:hypothetical protein [Gemmataceae bacterium]